MKFTKRMLAVLLTFALALALALQSMAAVNWDDFRIIRQSPDITIKHGDSFTLYVEVVVPDGVEVEYQWNLGNTRIENATTSELHLAPGDPNYPQEERLGGASANYRCRITAYEKDDAGNEVSSQKLATSMNVHTKRTASGKLYGIFVEPFVYAFGGTVALISMTMGIAIPVSPIIFLGSLIFGFIKGIIGLF